MEIITIPLATGENLFARYWKPESAPRAAICLLHGLSDHSGRFEYVGNMLAEHGYAFIAPDLRGNGKSPGRHGHFDSIDQVICDISSVIEYIKSNHPGLPVFVYGQSMGGNLAISFALKFPALINGVISSSPWLRLANPPAKFVTSVARLLQPIFPGMLIPNGLKSADLSHDEAIQKAYDSDPLIHWKISLNTFFIIRNSGEQAIEKAETLGVPLLLMHGDSDMITSFEASSEFARKAGNKCTFIRWPGLFHELHNEPAKEHVLGKMIEWLDNQI